ncbi:MAG: hypothetical protein ACHQNA_13215 [Acidimicrobiales bacterium]
MRRPTITPTGHQVEARTERGDDRRAPISVIGPCAAPACDRPARVHLEVEVAGRTLRGPVCDRCERATRLGAVLLGGSERRPA